MKVMVSLEEKKIRVDGRVVFLDAMPSVDPNWSVIQFDTLSGRGLIEVKAGDAVPIRVPTGNVPTLLVPFLDAHQVKKSAEDFAEAQSRAAAEAEAAEKAAERAAFAELRAKIKAKTLPKEEINDALAYLLSRLGG